MDELSLEHFTGRAEPAFLFGAKKISFAELADAARSIVPTGGIHSLVADPTDQNLRTVAARILAQSPIFPVHPKWSEVQRSAAEVRLTTVDEGEKEPLLAILATSGSTGEPKLVRLSRRAFIESAQRSSLNVPLVAGDRWLLAMPFAHAGGLSIITRCLLAKATVVVHPAFDPARILESISRERVTHLSVVPTTLRALLAADRDDALSRLSAMLVGGAACPPDLIEEAWRRRIPALTTYGLTETCSQIVTQSLGSHPSRTATDSGVPMNGVQITLVDSDGQVATADGVGRIAMVTPTLMSGYVGARWLPAHSRFVTEDLGRIDDQGRLLVLGRADDTIVTGGENVHPLEIERELLALGGISDALVAGVPNPTWGQLVAALVVLEEGANLAEVEARAKTKMASSRRPRLWQAVPTIPTNPIGKPDRKAVRQLLVQSTRPAT